MSNYKYHGIKDAKKQFVQDLQQDKDYNEYKQRCMMDNYMSYGCVSANLNVYLLNQIGPTSESLIANYLKETK
jgi:hypothetical protein